MINHLLLVLSLLEYFYDKHMTLCEALFGDSLYEAIHGAQMLLSENISDAQMSKWNADCKCFWYRRITVPEALGLWSYLNAHMPENWQEEARDHFNYTITWERYNEED